MENSKLTKFVAIYDGPAHENHEINIVTLGKSLSSLGELLYETNDVLNGDRGSIDVKVNADFIEGSFGFEVELIQNLVGAKDILAPLGLLGAAAVTGTVLGVVDWLKGEEISVIEPEDDSDNASVYVNGDNISCPKDVATLVSNPKIRHALEDIIRAPLMREGTTSVAFKKDKKDKVAGVKIDEVKAESFTRLSLGKINEEDTVDVRVKFTAANVNKKTGWQIELDGKNVAVKMEDQAFRERLINMEESYVFGRRFNVKMTVKTSKTLSKTTTTRSVVQVKSEVPNK